MSGTTPGRTLHVYVGGNRTVRIAPSFVVEQTMDEIGVPGREREDHVHFVPGVGYRLTDAHTFADLVYEQGAASTKLISPRNGTGILASYADTDDPVLERPAQRYKSELADSPQGSQTIQGSYRIFKHARQLGGLGSDWTAYPPPDTGETVPLDRVLVGNIDMDADDEFITAFAILGTGGTVLDSLYRFYFPSIAGISKQDSIEGRHGTGQYCGLCAGNGLMFLHERLDDGQWRFRKTLRYSGERDVIGREHVIRVSSDAVRDGDGKIFGKAISFGFGSIPALGQGKSFTDQVISTVLGIVDLSTIQYQTTTYRVPSPQSQPASAARTKIRVDARRDCPAWIEAWRTEFDTDGTLYCKTVSLKQAPKDGVLQVQVYGSFPTGTSATLTLYGAQSNTACSVATTVVDNRIAKVVDFNVQPGELSYILHVNMVASSDQLKSPTVRRVRYYRAAEFEKIVDPEIELVNVDQTSITGCGTDQSTETLGLVCYDFTGLQNAILARRSGMWVRVECDLGPDPKAGMEGGPPAGTRITTVLFRGIVKEAKRRRRAGKGKQGFGNASPLRRGPYTKITVRAISEKDWLMRRLAPGRLNLAYNGEAAALAESSKVTPYKVTDILRYLLSEAVGEDRVDVPDLSYPFPLDQDLPTALEMYQPTIPLCEELAHKYLGGWIAKDHNASKTGDLNDKEGIWRVKIPPKRSQFKRVAEFWMEPIVPGAVVTDPAAYPPTMDGTRPIVRTFFRQETHEQWIQAPRCNQVVVRGVVASSRTGVLMLGEVSGGTFVGNNWKTANFGMGERQADGTVIAQGAAGGPPAADPDSIDYTTGDVDTLYHSDPMLSSEDGVQIVGRRIVDSETHAREWASGEGPLVLVTKATTLDPLQIRPRPLAFGDIVTIKEAKTEVNLDGSGIVVNDGLYYVIGESPSILIDGRQGGSSSTQAYYSAFEAPPNDAYRFWVGEACI